MAREDRVSRRRDPSLILPGVQAVVMSTLFYWPGRSGFPREHDVPGYKTKRRRRPVGMSEKLVGPSRGVVSSYAWGDDYHALLEDRLRALGEWLNARAGGIARYYVDTGAVLERDFAERAGLGFVGKNSLLIHPRAGSGFFIGGLFTTVPLPLDGDEDRRAGDVNEQRGRPGCGKCTKCKDACPTGAIVEDRVVDGRKCISYLTIELKSSIPEELRPLMGSRIYGCDICQQVCPWNSFDWTAPTAAQRVPKADLRANVAPAQQTDRERSGKSPLFGSPGIDVTTPRLAELLWETKRSFKQRFRGTAVERIGHERMARNAAVALGNVGSGRVDLAAVGAAAFAHASPMVREHAQWALLQMKRREVASDGRSDSGGCAARH